MRTDQLIRTLAADARPAVSVERRLAAVLLPAVALTAVVFLWVLGPRPDIAAVANDTRFLFKFVVTLTLAATATTLVLRLARPGSEVRFPALTLAAAPVLLAIGVLLEFTAVEPAARTMKLVGNNIVNCLSFIPLFAIPILAGALLGLRHGAATRPALAGAVAGLLAGGLSATLYAANCTDDSPFFVATWYTIAIAAVTAAGALLGARVLRW
jgi:hypothetical protein